MLAANTPNDGSESITIPQTSSVRARIKVEAVGNVFFDINNADFVIRSPTAAQVEVSGRVLTADGRGIGKARVKVTDSEGNVRSALSNSFGYYRVSGLAAGQTYVFSVPHKRYNFAPRVLSASSNTDEYNFVAAN